MKVTLVGAGPGDKGLLTLRGAQAIAEADVVLYDRFVGAEILKMIPDAAERINVGKVAGNHPVPQGEINRLLYEKAAAGANVVRLKGGDPFVFGRGGEELELLCENGIPFEVVPGVTSAIAGPAYAGIPVTHRDFASSVHFITSQAKNNEKPNIDFDALVSCGGTLVFLMGVSALEDICTGCLEAGMSADMPAAVVENATLPAQRRFVGTVQTLPTLARQNGVVSPALIVVGEVCRLADSYDWFSKRPLHGKRVLVPRVKTGTSRLADGLRELGADVWELQTAQLEPIAADESGLLSALATVEEYTWLVLTSEFGVKVFFEQAFAAGVDIRALSHLRFACVGSETANALAGYGIVADYLPNEFNGQALSEGLVSLLTAGERLLIARAKDGSVDLTTALSEAGLDYDEVCTYARGIPPIEVRRFGFENYQTDDGVVDLTDFDYVALTSSSAVEGLAAAGLTAAAGFTEVKAVCIGQRTARAAAVLGISVQTSKQATIAGLVEKILELNENADQNQTLTYQ